MLHEYRFKLQPASMSKKLKIGRLISMKIQIVYGTLHNELLSIDFMYFPYPE